MMAILLGSGNVDCVFLPVDPFLLAKHCPLLSAVVHGKPSQVLRSVVQAIIIPTSEWEPST
jgi:hypothetical protein